MVLAFLIASVFLAPAAYLVRIKSLNYLLVALHWLLLLGLNIYEFYHVDQLEDRFFKADSLGLIFLTVLTILGLTTQIHSYIYNTKRGESMRNIAIHNGGFIVFVTAIAGVTVCTHLGLLWAFVEATTLAAAVLIYHDRNMLALEATWKYIFVCSIGIALAFAGILFLGIAAQDTETLDFSMAEIRKAAPQMNPVWLKVCFLFILTGFSVKMGIAPLFNVDIDAKDVSPSPIGAMFSSCLMNVGFISIFRFYECFSGSQIQPWMNKVLLISGVLSIFFATTYLLKVQNFKRAFAYSSMEHGGLVIIALASGGLGYFAAILHLVLHSFTKASLFYQIGQVHRVFESKHENFVGGYLRLNPYGGMVMLLGLISVLAMPPFGLFVSEFMTFRALAESGNWLVLGLCLVLLSFIVYSLTRKFMVLLFGPFKYERGDVSKVVHPAETITQFVLLGIVMYCGIVQPEFLAEFIRSAIKPLALR